MKQLNEILKKFYSSNNGKNLTEGDWHDFRLAIEEYHKANGQLVLDFKPTSDLTLLTQPISLIVEQIEKLTSYSRQLKAMTKNRISRYDFIFQVLKNPLSCGRKQKTVLESALRGLGLSLEMELCDYERSLNSFKVDRIFEYDYCYITCIHTGPSYPFFRTQEFPDIDFTFQPGLKIPAIFYGQLWHMSHGPIAVTSKTFYGLQEALIEKAYNLFLTDQKLLEKTTLIKIEKIWLSNEKVRHPEYPTDDIRGWSYKTEKEVLWEAKK